jgi:peptidoglycan-associated lipoprotein
MKLKLAIAGLALVLSGCQHSENTSAYQNSVKPDAKTEQPVKVAGHSASEKTANLTTVYYFQYDKSAIDDTNKKLLEAVAEYLMKNPEAHVNVIGNTDIRGTKEYNLALGQRRADAVAKCLQEHGAKASQITVSSHGKEKPLSTTENDQAQSLNRRVEIVFTHK